MSEKLPTDFIHVRVGEPIALKDIVDVELPTLPEDSIWEEVELFAESLEVTQPRIKTDETIRQAICAHYGIPERFLFGDAAETEAERLLALLAESNED